MFPTRIIDRTIVPAILLFALAAPAVAQLRPTTPPPKGNGTTWYASVTLENKTDIAIVFKMTWDGSAPETVTLDAGRSLTTRTSFKSGQTEPGLKVEFESSLGSTSLPVIQPLKAGMDTKNTNVGRIYDFNKKTTSLGQIIELKPR